MATATLPQDLLTSGEAAVALGLRDWQLGRLFARGLAEEPPRLGRHRMIDRADLPKLRDAAVRAGYLHSEPAAQPAPQPAVA
jgi:hypothetical protein